MRTSAGVLGVAAVEILPSRGKELFSECHSNSGLGTKRNAGEYSFQSKCSDTGVPPFNQFSVHKTLFKQSFKRRENSVSKIRTHPTLQGMTFRR